MIAGRPLALPALDIHTVGAGGGSIAWRDPGGALRVGPTSAGADPGPACYGRGGERPTVTDANLLLGRLLEDSPLAGGVALDRDAAERAIAALAGELGLDSLACAEGIVRVAEAEMLGALRVMTVERGIDPRGVRADAVRRRGAAARGRARRAARHHARAVPARLGRAVARSGWPPRRRAATSRARVMLRGAELSHERLAHERGRARSPRPQRLWREPPARARVRHELRYGGQSFELPVDEELEPPARAARGRGPDAEELRAAFATRARAALRLPRRGRGGRAREHARLGVGPRAGAAAGGARRRERGRTGAGARVRRQGARGRGSSAASPRPGAS